MCYQTMMFSLSNNCKNDYAAKTLPREHYVYGATGRLDRIRDKVTSLLAKSEYSGLVIGSCLGEGGNNTCFEVRNDPDLVILAIGTKGFGANDNGNDQREVMELEKVLPLHAAIARTLSVITVENRTILILQRAHGKPLHNPKNLAYQTYHDRLKELAEIPQEHFNTLVATAICLNENGFSTDPSKPSNIMYDQNNGFTFIDITLRPEPRDDIGIAKSLAVPLINTADFYNKFKKDVTDEDVKNATIILEKLKNSGADNSKLAGEIANFVASRNNIVDLASTFHEAVDGVW